MLNRDYNKDVVAKFKIASDRISMARINPSQQHISTAKSAIKDFETTVSDFILFQESIIKSAQKKKESLDNMSVELDHLLT